MYEDAEVHLRGGLVISSKSIVFPKELEYGVNEDFLKIFVLSYLSFLSDSPLEANSCKPLHVYAKFYRELTSVDLRVTIKRFSSIADRILSESYTTGGEGSTSLFVSEMIDTPIFKEYHQWLKTGRPDLLKYVLSFLLFGKKIAYTDASLDSTAFRGWVEVEERLSKLEFSPHDLANLRHIVGALLEPIRNLPFLGHFGPGKVSEESVTTIYDKLSSLTVDSKVAWTFRASALDGQHESRRSNTPATSNSSRAYSRLKFVPKDISKSRSICMEPNGYMYFQQHVLHMLQMSMEKGLINSFVDMSDQTKNQLAAIHGSTYLSSDTIDLSSASDSVHAELVKGIFPSWAKYYLFGTRTSRVQIPDKSIIDVKKFAPMGSAVCFPTQCIVFTAVCVYAMMAHSLGKTTEEVDVRSIPVAAFLRNQVHRVRTPMTPFTARYEPPVVFGDDIITDSRVSGEVISTLERLGFSVNVSKSFIGSQSFRESCGVYSWDGQDVTPVRFRLSWFKRGRWDAQVYTSLLSGINNMRDAGYHKTASFWLSVVLGYGFKYPLPFTTNRDAFGIFTLNKHKVPEHLLRWNADWQIHEEIIQGIGPRPIRQEAPSGLEEYRYNQYWRNRIWNSATPLSERMIRIRPVETRLAPRWARCE